MWILKPSNMCNLVPRTSLLALDGTENPVSGVRWPLGIPWEGLVVQMTEKKSDHDVKCFFAYEQLKWPLKSSCILSVAFLGPRLVLWLASSNPVLGHLGMLTFISQNTPWLYRMMLHFTAPVWRFMTDCYTLIRHNDRLSSWLTVNHDHMHVWWWSRRN